MYRGTSTSETNVKVEPLLVYHGRCTKVARFSTASYVHVPDHTIRDLALASILLLLTYKDLTRAEAHTRPPAYVLVELEVEGLVLRIWIPYACASHAYHHTSKREELWDTGRPLNDGRPPESDSRNPDTVLVLREYARTPCHSFWPYVAVTTHAMAAGSLVQSSEE